EDVDLPCLPIPVDAPHPLFQPVWIPRDVVVDHEMAKLEVDALASCLSGNQDLGFVLEHGLRFDPLFELHVAMNRIDSETPRADPLFQVVQSVLRFGEYQNLLARLLGSKPI